MLAEVGQWLLSVAVCLAAAQGLLLLTAAAAPVRRKAWMNAGGPLAAAQIATLAAALLTLTILFLQNDFSVTYVAQNSNTALPAVYRIAAVWGGHEGSMLLWCFMLSLWTAAVAAFSKGMPAQLRARALGVLGLVGAGFLLFLTLASSPFTRLHPAPAEGRDLNPLLQDPGLIFHPPMLYMGYVGFSVVFALSLAALMEGRMDAAWARWARPWTTAAWVFLTLGIALGSWWAYYELGWGGWWFWDPVENASFMPWLAGAALLHSLAATEARGVFKAWTALLAILTFALCLLGAFLVRSGVLTSVHAFATDPARGFFILSLLFLTVCGALGVYAARARELNAAPGGRFSPLSRESGILLNNIFFTAACFAVLVGTLYPLILDALNAGKISVGPPYFNAVFAPLAAVPAALAVWGAASRWKTDAAARIVRRLAPPLLAAGVLGAAAPLLAAGEYRPGAAAGFALGFWILLGTARTITRGRGGGFWGMIIAHAGVGVFVLGVTAVNVYGVKQDARLKIGEGAQLGGRTFTLVETYEQRRENYDAMVGVVRVEDGGQTLAMLRPEKRRYFARPEEPMTEAGIAAKWSGDLYVSLGEPLGGGAWSARLQIKPFVRLIWGGALLMAIGGALAAADRRYRRRRAVDAEDVDGAPPVETARAA